MLVNVSRLVSAYCAEHPDVAIAAERVASGTSGHRGSAFARTFNEAHILAITQAICNPCASPWSSQVLVDIGSVRVTEAHADVHAHECRPRPRDLPVHPGATSDVQRPGALSRSGRRAERYAWLKRPLSHHASEDARLLRLIRASFIASQGIYGAPRVFLDLREAGETCGTHRVARLMREHQLRALHGYRMRRWSVGKPAVLIPNLLKRQFTVTRRNTAWVTDITYIRTWQGWLYLAVVMDFFSRKIVGWSAGRASAANWCSTPC